MRRRLQIEITILCLVLILIIGSLILYIEFGANFSPNGYITLVSGFFGLSIGWLIDRIWLRVMLLKGKKQPEKNKIVQWLEKYLKSIFKGEPT